MAKMATGRIDIHEVMRRLKTDLKLKREMEYIYDTVEELVLTGREVGFVQEKEVDRLIIWIKAKIKNGETYEPYRPVSKDGQFLPLCLWNLLSWITQYDGNDQKKEVGSKPEHLRDWFIDIIKYHPVMDIMVDAEFLHPQTYLWADTKKGKLQTIAAFIKDLGFKGYLKKVPKTADIINLAKGTFNEELKERNTRDAPKTLDNSSLIPFASTLQ